MKKQWNKALLLLKITEGKAYISVLSKCLPFCLKKPEEALSQLEKAISIIGTTREKAD